jgi:hypothetical protein
MDSGGYTSYSGCKYCRKRRNVPHHARCQVCLDRLRRRVKHTAATCERPYCRYQHKK